MSNNFLQKTLLIFSIITSINLSNILEFKFKNKFSETSPDLNYLEQFVNNSLYIEIPIGTPAQKVPFQITFDESTTYILQSSNLFDRNKSSSYKLIDEKKNIWNQRYENGLISNDSIKLQTIKKKTVNLDHNFSFVLVKDYNTTRFNRGFPSSILGLNLDVSFMETDLNFLTILKLNNIINSFTFTLKYTKENEGKIFIGGFPHEFDKNYNEKDLRSTLCEKIGPKFFYSIYFDNIQIGNDQIGNNFNKIGELKPDFGLIVGGSGFKSKIEEIYFNKYYQKEICSNVLIYKTFWETWERDEDDEEEFDYDSGNNDAFKVIVCSDKIDVKKFPSLKFYNKDLEVSFELNYKDLFKKYKNKYYFLIVEQNIYLNYHWKFGTPFLKKYEFTFDQDKKTINYYVKVGKKSNFNVLWIFIIILLIIIITLVYVLYKKVFLKKKGKKNKDIDFEGKTNYTKLGI